MTGVQHMEIVFHTGKDSEQSLRQFAEKRAEFLTRELRDLNAEELKALLSTLKEDHRTFEQKWGRSYNNGEKGGFLTVLERRIFVYETQSKNPDGTWW